MDHSTTQSNKAAKAPVEAAVQPQAAEEIDALPESLQQLVGIGALTSGIARELVNLLSIITTASISLRYELQRQEILSDETIRHYMQLIERNAFRSARIVEVLQAYGAQDALHMAVTDIDAILQDAMMLVERQFREESDVRVDVQPTEMPVAIFCDHRRVVQLLVNLLLNTREAVGVDGGSIAVSVHPYQNGSAARRQESGPVPGAGVDWIAITISGDGPARAADGQEYPLTLPESADPHSGAGLSLNVSREIVRQHHGELLVGKEKGSGEGAIFSVKLPLRPAH